jgi:ubiquinone/menaquinone biosynthesis C-methylase UbiE
MTSAAAPATARVVGLDRAPAMLAALRRRHPRLPVVLADAHHLPFRHAAVDVAVFITTLEFLEQPGVALAEAVRVAGHGVVLVVLNLGDVLGVVAVLRSRP